MGIKKCEILARISIGLQVAFDALWFQNGATYWKRTLPHGAAMTDSDMSSIPSLILQGEGFKIMQNLA